MKATTLACLLAPVAVMASPCRHSPATSAVAYPTAPAPAAPAAPSSSATAVVSSSTASSATSSAPTSATARSSPVATPTTEPAAKPVPSSDSIQELFKAKGKQYFGTAADAQSLRNPRNAAVINKDFGQLTPENSMKWDAIEPRQGSFSFAGSDALVDYAAAHGKTVRGHTLLWYQQLPSYVSAISNADELTRVLQNHITTIVRRYKGKVHAWDVVNEILNEDGTLRDCVFTQLLGEDFVRIAFEAAHAADPEAKLYINEYHLESGSNAKVTAMASYVKKWLDAGLPIDGVGLQGHLGGSNPSAAGMQAGMELLAKTGVSELAITELDIVGAPAEEYVEVAKACLAVDACVGITVWGVSDADSWLSRDTPLLFDSNYQPKPAYDALVQLLS